jgi:hypothetical protein
MKHFLIFYCTSEDLMSCLVQITFSLHLFGSHHQDRLVHEKLLNLSMGFKKIYHLGFLNLMNHNCFIDIFIAKNCYLREYLDFDML